MAISVPESFRFLFAFFGVQLWGAGPSETRNPETQRIFYLLSGVLGNQYVEFQMMATQCQFTHAIGDSYFTSNLSIEIK